MAKKVEEEKTKKTKKQVKEDTKETKNTKKQVKEDIKETKNTKKQIKKEPNKENKEIVKKEINEKELQKVEEEIKNITTITEERKKKIDKRIFQNILIACVVVLYFIFINLGFKSIDPQTYLRDLQVFSIVTILATILIFERAYKNDNGEIAIYGIEMLAISICTLMTIYVGMYLPTKYLSIINLFAMAFAIYYVGKSIFVYKKMKKNALKKENDMYKTIEG